MSPLLAGDMAADVLGQLNRLIADQFRDIAAAGPAMYANFLGADNSNGERRHVAERLHQELFAGV